MLLTAGHRAGGHGPGIRGIGPADAGAVIALAATDNLFDEGPATAPSGELTPDGACNFLADPSVLFWLADFYRQCGFATDEGEILVKELLDWTPRSGLVRV